VPGVSWLAYALATVVLWTAWSFLGVVALRSVSPPHATILFGIATTVVGVASLVLGRSASWSPSGMAVAAISGVCGGLGIGTYYLALAHGKASSVAPVVGAYPAFVALLAVVFLSERMSAIQVLGVALAVLGIILIGAAG
jgi:uncharacterized membrane protein